MIYQQKLAEPNAAGTPITSQSAFYTKGSCRNLSIVDI